MRKIILSALLLSTMLSELSAESLRDQVVSKLIKTSDATHASLEELNIRLKASEERTLTLEKEVKELKANASYVDITKKEVAPTESVLLAHINKTEVLKATKYGVVKTKKKVVNNDSENYIVTAWKIKIRKEPSRTSKVVGYSGMGRIMSAIPVEDNWVKTEKGYIKNSLIKKIGQKRLEATVIKDYVNVRNSPIILKNISGKLFKNNTVKLYPVMFNTEWYGIENSKTYVHKNCVKVQK